MLAKSSREQNLQLKLIRKLFSFSQSSSKKKARQIENLQQPRNYRTCVKCPGQFTAIARKGLDGVLFQPPAPLSCKNDQLPFAESLFRIETLFDAALPFVLPRGNHSLVARILNVETGQFVRSCRLKYRVVVRRCKGFPKIDHDKLKMSCTAHTLWGSACAFECRNDDEYLSHQEPMICNDNLQWIGGAPDCIQNDIGE